MSTKWVVITVAVVLLGGGVLLVAVCGLCGGMLFVGFRNTEAAVSPAIDELFVAIQNDKFAETYQTHTTPELRQATSQEKYQEIGDAIRVNLGALQSKQLQQFNARQMNATSYVDVTYSANFEKGSGTIKAKLQKSGGKWLFAGFNVDSPAFQKNIAVATCPKCGKPHAAGARFCPACGASLTNEPATPEQPAESP
jgi:hypothetical protein